MPPALLRELVDQTSTVLTDLKVLEFTLQDSSKLRTLRALRSGLTAVARRGRDAHEAFFAPLRQQIAEGAYLFEHFERDLERHKEPFFWGIFNITWPPAPELPLEPSMVFYVPSPACDIIGLMRAAQLGPHDLVYDLGSGVGAAAGLIAWGSGARVIGIDYQGSYVRQARKNIKALGLERRTRFIHSDVRDVDLSRGTRFFVYYPFSGPIARHALGQIEAAAEDHNVSVMQVHPSTWSRIPFLPERIPLPNGCSVHRKPGNGIDRFERRRRRA
jgi:predicted RNA methylase